MLLEKQTKYVILSIDQLKSIKLTVVYKCEQNFTKFLDVSNNLLSKLSLYIFAILERCNTKLLKYYSNIFSII